MDQRKLYDEITQERKHVEQNEKVLRSQWESYSNSADRKITELQGVVQELRGNASAAAAAMRGSDNQQVTSLYETMNQVKLQTAKELMETKEMMNNMVNGLISETQRVLGQKVEGVETKANQMEQVIGDIATSVAGLAQNVGLAAS